MWHELWRTGRLYELLQRIDEELCDEVRRRGCGHCGGRLDAAHYPRKPRGGPPDLAPGYQRRLSLCCARDGCRKRATPASVRFLGRRVYLGAVVVLVSALEKGPSPKRMARLRELLGVTRWTVERWRRWWLDDFVRTPCWRAGRTRLMPAVNEAGLPGTLLERFASEEFDRLVAMLRFVSPLTVSGPGP